MELHQSCERVAILLRTPLRLYSDSGAPLQTYPRHTLGEPDPLLRERAFRVRLLRMGREDFPVLYLEQDTLLYGVMVFSDGCRAILGPVRLTGGPLMREFCEGLLLLDDLDRGRHLGYERLVALNFGTTAGVPPPEDGVPTESLLVSRCKREISRRLHGKITAKDLAETLGVNLSYLSRVFHEEQGATITDYVTGEKIRQAQKMLLTTDASAETIAYELGFSSQSYFGAVFKKLVGCTPREYRMKAGDSKSVF